MLLLIHRIKQFNFSLTNIMRSFVSKANFTRVDFGRFLKYDKARQQDFNEAKFLNTESREADNKKIKEEVKVDAVLGSSSRISFHKNWRRENYNSYTFYDLDRNRDILKYRPNAGFGTDEFMPLIFSTSPDIITNIDKLLDETIEKVVELQKDKIVQALKKNFKKTGKESDFDMEEELAKLYEMSEEKFEENFIKKTN